MSTWTRAVHPEAGEAILPLAALPNMPYWEPVGEPADSQQELLIRRDEERAAALDAEKARVVKAAEAVEAGEKKDDVLDVVAGDPAAARAALEAELAKDKPRTTLVHGLEEIIERPGDAATEGD